MVLFSANDRLWLVMTNNGLPSEAKLDSLGWPLGVPKRSVGNRDMFVSSRSSLTVDPATTIGCGNRPSNMRDLLIQISHRQFLLEMSLPHVPQLTILNDYLISVAQNCFRREAIPTADVRSATVGCYENELVLINSCDSAVILCN